MSGIKGTKKELPILKNNDEPYVHLQGSHFQQSNIIITNNSNVINISIVYKLDPISSTRDTTFTIQNALFGAMELLKLLILVSISTKDMVFVLMKEIGLVLEILIMEETY